MEILDDTIERYRKIFGCEPQMQLIVSWNESDPGIHAAQVD